MEKWKKSISIIYMYVYITLIAPANRLLIRDRLQLKGGNKYDYNSKNS